MNNGWIKIHRKMLDWEWFLDEKTFHLFLYFLLTVNVEQKKWQRVLVNPGQKITSYQHLSDETGLSVRSIRTSISKLKTTGELTYQTTSKYGLVTILNWKKYQGTTDNTTGERQASDRRATTTKEYKNIRSKETIVANATEGGIMFDSNAYIEGMLESKQRHIHIIGMYYRFTNTQFPAIEAVQFMLKQELKAAKALVGYTDSKILEVMEYLNKQFVQNKLESWNVTTITKYINKI
jgi:hypothetical protein